MAAKTSFTIRPASLMPNTEFPTSPMPEGLEKYMTEEQYAACVGDINELVKTKSSIGEGAASVGLAVVTFGISTAWTNTLAPAVKAYDKFPGMKVTR
jgi:hypothetical protein